MPTIDNKTLFKELSPSSQAWVTAALDPFHDVDVAGLQGIPNVNGEDSVVMHIKKDLTITRPTDAGFTGEWDAHFAAVPYGGGNGPHQWLNSWYADTGVMSIAGAGGVCEDFAGTATTQPFGLVTVSASATGKETFIASSATDTSKFDCLDIDEEVLGAASNSSPVFMLIAGGFEVHNVTPELNKQGTVVVYSSPNCVEQNMVVCADGSSDTYNTLVAKTFTMPPQAVATAKSYSDSRTWEARDGCYVPFRLDVEDMKPQLARPCANMVLDPDSTRAIVDFGNYTGDIMGVGSGIVDSALGQAYHFPVATSGAYFTGLGAETVLTLTMHAFVEVIPRQNAILRTLASPSAPYEFRAMEVYSAISRLLPPGTQVCNNASGDWWKLIRRAYMFIRPGMLAIPQTRGAALAADSVLAAVSTVEKAIDDARKKDQKPVATLPAATRIPKPKNLTRGRLRSANP